MTTEHFYVPYAKKFSEAEFRKRVQFMTAGELKTIRFLFKNNPDSVIDRLPTANIEEQTPDGVVIRAEVYGDGVDMWIRSQWERLTLL
jgi:hypothetical protein